jgi:uncharacterized protein YrzB (UPF0473 family)
VGENEDVITLLDEEGTEHEFSIVDVLEVSDQRYAILQPLEGGDDPDTAVIFRMEGDALVTIEDDAEFERVRAAFEAEAADGDTGNGAGSNDRIISAARDTEDDEGPDDAAPDGVDGAADLPPGHDSTQSH